MDVETQNELKEFLQREFLRLCPVIKEVEDSSNNTLFPVYKVQLQEISFLVPLDNVELKTCIDYAVKIMNLFEELSKAGITIKKCLEISNSIKNNTLKHLKAYYFFNHEEIKSKIDIISLAQEISEFRRNGGAYWMLEKGPMFYEVLFSVLTVILEDFSDINRYIECVYMVFRTILYLHDYSE